MVMPFFDKCILPIPLKEVIADFQSQSVITEDNVTMQIDLIVYFQITEPKLIRYGENNNISEIEKVTITTLRTIIGNLKLDEALTSRDAINAKMREIIDESTRAWGIKINRVELKDILPSQDI